MFNTWLQGALVNYGCNQAALAKKMKLDRSMICNWYHGVNLPQPINLLTLASSLDLDKQGIIDMIQAYINTLQKRIQDKKCKSE